MSEEDIAATPVQSYYFGSSIFDERNNISAGELKEVEEKVRKEVIEGYEDFIKFFFNLNNKMSFAQYFGTEGSGSFKKYEEVLTSDAEQDFATVLEERLKDFQDSDPFEDSLFFYPLWGGIFRLAAYISQH